MSTLLLRRGNIANVTNSHTIEMIKSRKTLLCCMTHEKTITINTYMYQRNAKLGDILNTCLILFATAG